MAVAKVKVTVNGDVSLTVTWGRRHETGNSIEIEVGYMGKQALVGSASWTRADRYYGSEPC